jgi:ABC-2 type transport system ATP-binding protein
VVAGDPVVAVEAVRSVPGVTKAEAHGHEVTVDVDDGAALLSPVAVALNACGVTVRGLTLRTPTLDDVFLEFTGNRLLADAESGDDR